LAAEISSQVTVRTATSFERGIVRVPAVVLFATTEAALDITDIILDQHDEQRRLFAFLREIDRGDRDSLSAIWKRLQGLLDAHAEAEERFFYPRLLKEGSGASDAASAADETRDAIEDHNKIRDAAKSADDHEVGTDRWLKAVCKADLENSKHMAEEERQALADFRRSASVEERHQLGVQFLAFVSGHLMGVKPVDKNPEAYVKDPQREIETSEA
jgi:hypothetical protein